MNGYYFKVIAQNLSIIILTNQKLDKKTYLKLKQLSIDSKVEFLGKYIVITFFYDRFSDYQKSLEQLNRAKYIEIETMNGKATTEIVDINHDFVVVKYSTGKYRVPLKAIKLMIDILERPRSVREYEEELRKRGYDINIKSREGKYITWYMLPYLLLMKFGNETGKIHIFKKKKNKGEETYIYLNCYIKREELFKEFINYLKNELRLIE